MGFGLYLVLLYRFRFEGIGFQGLRGFGRLSTIEQAMGGFQSKVQFPG